MVYASTLRHECMGVHTSERAITFFASPSQAEAPIMHTLTCAFFGNTEPSGGNQRRVRARVGRVRTPTAKAEATVLISN